MSTTISKNQIFQSSRRYLYHAVIGALALAAKQDRRAKFEDVYSLLLPKKSDFRDAVDQACADTPDLHQIAEFFRTELPQDLELAGSATAQRLDAPRNKVSLLTGVPPLRRLFNHTSDIAPPGWTSASGWSLTCHRRGGYPSARHARGRARCATGARLCYVRTATRD